MPIASTDLILYAAANTPENDTVTAGGAIDALRRLDFTQIAANDDIEALSDSAADTMNATLTGRNAAGAIVSETKALTGITAIIFSTAGILERVLKFELASAPAGNITVRRSVAGATVRVVPIGERGFEIFFYDSASESAGTTRYQKGFYKNAHGSLTLNNAAVRISADPLAIMGFTLASSKNDAATSANRKTQPAVGDTDPDTFDDTSKTVPAGTLEAASAIGVWVQMTLAADDTPKKSTFTLELSGTSV